MSEDPDPHIKINTILSVKLCIYWKTIDLLNCFYAVHYEYISWNDACQLNEVDMNLNDLNANTTDDSTL